MRDCRFDYKGVSDATLADIKLQDKENFRKLSFFDYGQLLQVLMRPEAKLSFNVLVDITNMGKGVAAISKMEWVALKDGKELFSDVYDGYFEVLPGMTNRLTIPVSIDLKKELNGENTNALKAFGMSFWKDKSIKGLTIKVKPYVNIAGKMVKYPAFFEITPH